MSVSIQEIKYKTESSGLSDVTIAFVGNVPTSGSTFKQSTIGEYVTAEIKYKLNVGNLDDKMIYYDFGLSLPFITTAIDKTKAYNIYSSLGMSTGVDYTMNLYIGGTGNTQTFEQNNHVVLFNRTNTTDFVIKHSFYMTMDMLQTFNSITGYSKKYRLSKSTWFTPSEFTNLDGTMYNSSSPRFVYHGCKVASSTVEYDRQSILPISAKFWNKNTNNSAPYYLYNNAEITDLLGTPLTGFSNVNATKINFYLDHAGLAPTTAIIRYFKYNASDTPEDWKTNIDLQTLSATITAVSGVQSKISATVPALPVGDYMIYDIVYRGVSGFVNSHYYVASSIGEVCIPVFEPATNNYENPDLQCSEYSIMERVALRMQFMKNDTNISIPVGFDDCCTALYGRDFDDCKKSVKLEVWNGTTTTDTFQAYWTGSNWIGNFDLIQDLVGFAGFNKAYRIPASFAGLDIELRWYLELDFGLFTETIYYVDKIRIKDAEPDVAFADITLKDPSGNVINNICDTDTYATIEVCRVSLTDNYRLVAVIEKGVTVYENDSFVGGTLSLPQKNDRIIFDLEEDFTTLCATYKIDTSMLNYDTDYTAYLIGYKI